MTVMGAISDINQQPPSPSSPSSSSSSHLSVASGSGGAGGVFTFKFEQNENGSFVVSVFQESRRSIHQQDDVGALYYVVAVILIYGCSILMMIASYIRKNKVDRRLNRYLKEMANVRKRERRMTLMSTAAASAKAKRPGTNGGSEGGAGTSGGSGGTKDPSRSQSPSPSFNLTPSGRESPAIPQTGENSPLVDMGVLHAAGCSMHSPFLGVDRLNSWPGLHPTSHNPHHQRPNSPVLIVCDHSDYDSDSEPNNSDRSDDRPRHPIKTGRKSVKLCVPIDLVPTEGDRRVAAAAASPGQTRRRADCSHHGTSAAKDYGSHQQDSLNSSDCKSDEESNCQKPLWNSTQVVSNV